MNVLVLYYVLLAVAAIVLFAAIFVLGGGCPGTPSVRGWWARRHAEREWRSICKAAKRRERERRFPF